MLKDSRPPFTDKALSVLAPAEVLTRMLEHTDEKGILYLCEMPCDDQDETQARNICRWEMAWDSRDCSKVISDFEELYFCLRKLASLQGSLTGENARELLPEENCYRVWDVLIRDFESCGIDEHTVQEISGRLSAGERITPGEAALLDTFTRSRARECTRRIGGSPAAYDVVMRAKRVHLFLIMEAPPRALIREANLLAESLALHRFGKSMTLVK